MHPFQSPREENVPILFLQMFYVFLCYLEIVIKWWFFKIDDKFPVEDI